MILTDSKGYDITSVAKINRYQNSQSPGFLWYHDHAMGLTNYHLIGGLSGNYIIKNHEIEKYINIPKEN